MLWHNLPAIELVADILLPSSAEPSDWNTSDSDNPSQQSFDCGVGVGVALAVTLKLTIPFKCSSKIGVVLSPPSEYVISKFSSPKFLTFGVEKL